MKSIRTPQLHKLRSLKNRVSKRKLLSRISSLQKLKGERRMMNIQCIKYGVFLPRGEKLSYETSAKCMSWCFKNSNHLARSKLRSHFQNKHGVCQNISLQFFKQQHEYLCKQQISLHSSVENVSARKSLFYFPLQTALLLMKGKKILRSWVCNQTIIEDR